jgi:sialidase-1
MKNPRPTLVILAALSLSAALRAAPRDGGLKAPGALFTHAELRAQFAYSIVSPRTEDSPRSDSASVAELQDGTLFLVWHKFRASPEHGSDFGHADIAAKISRDGGKTWVGERRLIEFAPGDKNIQAPAICALPSGDLVLAALRVHETNSSTMCVFRSKDQGRTWTETGKMWEKSTGQWLQGGVPSIVRLSNGRLVLPFHFGTGTQRDQRNSIGCFVSDDQGLTWRKTRGVIELPMRGAIEPSVAELANGRLLVSIRTQLGTPFLAESSDQAETWSNTWSVGFTAPEAGTCLRRIGKTNDLLLVFNGCEYYEPRPQHSHYGRRNPLTLATSRDNGRTWQRIGDIESDPNGEFTNINCLFTTSGDAVITYSVWSPPFNRKDPKRADLCSVVIPRDFFARNLR